MEDQEKVQKDLNELFGAVDPQKMLVGMPLAQKARMARLMRKMGQPYTKPSPKPRKPAPKGRAERLQRKWAAQAASSQEHAIPLLEEE